MNTPSLVKFDNPFVKIYQVSAGFRSSFFLCENRKIYSCGCYGSFSMEKIPVLFDIISKIPEMNIESNYSIVRIMNSCVRVFRFFMLLLLILVWLNLVLLN